MKDSDLYIHPDDWTKHHETTPEHEISCGGSEALHNKLKFIDSKLAELEVTSLDSRQPKLHGTVIWGKIVNLSAWYGLIEKELHNRIANASVNLSKSKFDAYYWNSSGPIFTRDMFKHIVGSP